MHLRKMLSSTISTKSCFRNMHTSVKKIAELENELIVIYLLINFVWRCMVDLYLKFHPSTLKDWWDWLYFIFKGTNINLLCKNAEETKMRKKHYKKGMIHSEFYKHFHRSSFSLKKTFSFSFYRVRIISYIFTNNKNFFIILKINSKGITQLTFFLEWFVSDLYIDKIKV